MIFSFLFTLTSYDAENVIRISDKSIIKKQIEDLKKLNRSLGIITDNNDDSIHVVQIKNILQVADRWFLSISLDPEVLKAKTHNDYTKPLLFEYSLERIPIGFLSMPIQHNNNEIIFTIPDQVYRLQRRRYPRFELENSDNIYFEYRTTSGKTVRDKVYMLGEGGMGIRRTDPFSGFLVASKHESRSGLNGKLYLTDKYFLRVSAEFLYDTEINDDEYSNYVGFQFLTMEEWKKKELKAILNLKKQQLKAKGIEVDTMSFQF